MSEKPILFNTEMVKAILDGRKTVTRRVMKPPKGIDDVFWNMDKCRKPYKVGDVLYIRETWNRGFFDSSDAEGDNSQWFEEYHKRDGGYLDKISHYIYRADFTTKEEVELGVEVKEGVYKMPWKPSIHMPKEAARIWLRVTEVSIERLHDMTDDDARQEGIDLPFPRVEDFVKLWDSTIKKQDLDKYGWEANPWVWVIEFEKCERRLNYADMQAGRTPFAPVLA